jgi:hypothetical protein
LDLFGITDIAMIGNDLFISGFFLWSGQSIYEMVIFEAAKKKAKAIAMS